MESLSSFHKTVQGYNHVKAGTPCEDYSDSFQDDTSRFYVGAVADGHGDPACFRSAFGSKAAATIAVGILKEFGEAYFQECSSTALSVKDQLGYENGRRILLRQITDRIISQWSSTVLKDIEQNHPSEEEYQASGRMEKHYRAGERLEHIYGTTLIAALWLPEYLILLQQGDGRCDVFYQDGSVIQPIPWDSRCYENVTTSLCDEDSADAIRTHIIDCLKTPVVACYLGSDGVEDYYPNPEETQEGTHCFYRKLSTELSKVSSDELAVEELIEPMLEKHTRDGNGDDVSVAGIYSQKELVRLAPLMERAVKQYESDDARQRQLKAYEQKIASMQRKHGILQRRYTEAQDETASCEQAVQMCQDSVNRLSAELEQFQAQQAVAYSEMQKETEEIGKARAYLDAQEKSDGFKVLLRYASEGLGLLRSIIEDVYQSKEKAYEQLSSRVSEKSSELEAKELELDKFNTTLEEAKSRLQQAQTAFEEYDAEYQRLCVEKQSLLMASNEASS